MAVTIGSGGLQTVGNPLQQAGVTPPPKLSRGGGGGGGMSIDTSKDVEARRIAQQKAEAERKRQEAAEMEVRLEQEKLRQQKIQSGTISGQLSSQTNQVSNLIPISNINQGKQFGSGTKIRSDFGKKDIGQVYTEPSLIQTDKGFVFVEPPKGGSGAYTYTPVTPEFKGSGLGATLTFNIEGYEPITTPASGQTEVKASTQKLDLVQSIESKQQQLGRKTGMKAGVASFGLGVGSAVVGTGLAIASPIQTAKGIGSAIVNPKRTLQSIKTGTKRGLQENPLFFFGEAAGYYGVGKVLSFGTKGVTKRVGIPKIKSPNKIKVDVIKPQKITKTPLSSTFPREFEIRKVNPYQRQLENLKSSSLDKPIKQKGLYATNELLESKIYDLKEAGYSPSSPRPPARQQFYIKKFISTQSKIIEPVKQQTIIKPLFTFEIEKNLLKKQPPKKAGREFFIRSEEVFEKPKQPVKQRSSQQQLLLEKPKQVAKQEQKVFQIVDQKQLQKFRQKQLQLQRQGQSSRLRYAQKTLLASSVALAQRSLFAQGYKQSSRQALGLKSLSAQASALSSAQPLALKQPQALRQSSRSKLALLQLGITPRMFKKRDISIGFGKKKSKSQRFKQRTQYQPSFTASSLNIKAVKTPEIVGVSVRPIIQGRGKRK